MFLATSVETAKLNPGQGHPSRRPSLLSKHLKRRLGSIGQPCLQSVGSPTLRFFRSARRCPPTREAERLCFADSSVVCSHILLILNREGRLVKVMDTAWVEICPRHGRRKTSCL